MPEPSRTGAILAAIAATPNIVRRLLVLSLPILVAVTAAGAGAQRVVAAPSLFVSPNGSDSGSCTRAAPCGSFERAYSLARPGAIVEVAGGRYGDQTLRPRQGRVKPKVIFRPAAGANVVLADLTIYASQLELRSMRIDNSVSVKWPSDAVTLRNTVNKGMFVEGASNTSFIGGEATCGVCDYHPQIGTGPGPAHVATRNLLFDGVYFHDWHAASGGQHTECLQLGSGDGVTIRNSVFRNCATANGGRGATAALHISWFGMGPVTRNVLVENNFFYPSGNSYVIQMNDFANTDLRYNSIAGAVAIFDRDGPGTGMDFIGNIMRFSGCSAERSGVAINWRYNVLNGGKCGATDRNAAPGFVSSNDLRLVRGAAAINRGDPKIFPRRDIHGQKRPKGGRADAGADER